MFIAESGFDPHVDEMYCPIHGFGQAVAVEQAACDYTGECVACARIRSRNIVATHDPGASVVPVIGNGRYVFAVIRWRRGDDYILRSGFS